MKSLSLLALLVVLQMQTATAQLTIGTDKLPVAGDRYVTAPMDTTGVSEGTAGGNKVWNFADLTPTGPSTTFWYVNATVTPYSQDFPNANLASYMFDFTDTTYAYFSTFSNKLTSHGSASPEFVNQYGDPEIQLSTPLIYNDQFTDQFRSVSQGEGFEIRSGGSISVINDSYGTINLPGGRTSIAGRLKFVRQNRDTAFVGGIPMYTSSMSIVSYEWFTPSSKFPVLQIAYYAHTMNGNTTTSKLVEYNMDQTTGVDDRGDGVASGFRLEQNYPNPFNPTTTMSFRIPNEGHVTLKVFNLIGQEVATVVDEQLPAGNYQVPFDGKGLASGMYIYRLSTPQFSSVKKMTLVR